MLNVCIFFFHHIVVENLPRLLPRAYSVASASGADSLSFAFNVIDLPSIGPLSCRKGLVTGRLNNAYESLQHSLPKVRILSTFI